MIETIELLGILVALATAALIVAAAVGTQATLRKRQRRASENGQEVFARIGGARIGSLHAIAPLAGLVATKSEIDLIMFGKDHIVARNEITRMSRYPGLFSTSILIEHKAPSNIDYLVFWSSRYEEARDALISLGYPFDD